MTIIEDAFDLARSGNHRSMSEVAKALRSRGHDIALIEDHLSGKKIRSEITQICRVSTIERSARSSAKLSHNEVAE